MVSAGDFRNGVTFDMDGNVYQIIEFQHVKPGKGAAFVRTKIRNVITGAVTERTFNPSDKYPTAYIERKDMEYLYSDGDLYYFMDQETYENIPINKSILSDNFKSAVHHVGRNFKNQLPRQGSAVAVQSPGHSQKALLKQGNFLQGGGTSRSIAFQQERTGRKDGRRVRQPYFRIPGSHGRQQAQNRQPDHGRLDNGTTVSF